MKGYVKFNWIPNRINIKKITVRKTIKEYFEKHLAGLFEMVIREYDELPINYNENSFTGYLAQAAYNAGGYAIIDYSDLSDDGKSYRPDLYLSINMKGKHWCDVVMEVKKDEISVRSHRDTIRKRISDNLKKAHKQLRRHRKAKESTYWCSLAILYVKPSRWKQIAQKKSFNEALSKVRNIVSQVCNDKGGRENMRPNFYFQYFLNRDKHDKLFSPNEGDERPDFLGCFVVGILEPCRN